MFNFVLVILAKISLVKSPKKGLSLPLAKARAKLLSLRCNSVKELWKVSQPFERLLAKEAGPQSDYHLVVAIEKLKVEIPLTVSPVVERILSTKLIEAEKALEAFSPPVPLERSTLPKWSPPANLLSGVSLKELETRLESNLVSLKKGAFLVKKIGQDYDTRSALWAAKQKCGFECAPKGTLKRYYSRLKYLKAESKGLEFEIARRELSLESVFLGNREDADGVKFASEVAADMRRFSEIKPSLDWADTQKMIKVSGSYPTPEMIEEFLSWERRVNGEDFKVAPEPSF